MARVETREQTYTVGGTEYDGFIIAAGAFVPILLLAMAVGAPLVAADDPEGAVEAVLAEYDRALGDERSHWSLRERYATIQRRSGGLDVAEGEWRRLAEQFPQYPSFELQLAHTLRAVAVGILHAVRQPAVVGVGPLPTEVEDDEDDANDDRLQDPTRTALDPPRDEGRSAGEQHGVGGQHSVRAAGAGPHHRRQQKQVGQAQHLVRPPSPGEEEEAEPGGQ